MAINQDIISTSWEGQQKSYIEAGLKTLLQRMLEVLESPLAANSVGSNQLTQELRDVINSIGSKVPNTRTVNSKELSSNITIGPDDIMVGDQTLADKLDDMDEAIGQGGDTSGLAPRIAALEQALDDLTGTEDTTQIIDTFNEVKAFLNGIDTDDPTLANQLLALNNAITALQTALAGKISGIKTSDNTPLSPDSNGIVTLPPAGSTISPATAAPQMDGNTAAVGSSAKYAREDHVHPKDTSKLSKSDVSVETQGDGTVDINVKDDTYKINLNHTHENMAKLEIVDEEPSDPAMDTIYALVDDATDPTEIQSLWIAGLEFVGGGGEPEPRLRFPINGSRINVDDLTNGGLFIRGYNLSQPLLVAVTGDFTINGGSSATVQVTDANDGTTLTLACTSQSYNASGSLVITSSDGINTSCSLIANVPNYESITAARFRGAQWVDFGFSVGPNTSFELDIRFAEDSQLAQTNATFLSCADSERPNLFQANFTAGTLGSIYFWVGDTFNDLSGSLLGRGVFSYSNGSVSFRGATTTPPQQTVTNTGFTLGESRSTSTIFNYCAMTVYGLKVYENGVLTHDFVPKKIGTVVGFLDTMTGAFVSSQTSTELEEVNA